MCFEWDKRYFRELEAKKSKEKVDEMIKNAEDAVSAIEGDVKQPSDLKENALI